LAVFACACSRRGRREYSLHARASAHVCLRVSPCAVCFIFLPNGNSELPNAHGNEIALVPRFPEISIHSTAWSRPSAFGKETLARTRIVSGNVDCPLFPFFRFLFFFFSFFFSLFFSFFFRASPALSASRVGVRIYPNGAINSRSMAFLLFAPSPL